MLIEDQSEVLSLLSRPETFGAAIEEVERIDTHASAIFLAGDRAYKLKRAVKYPYLDYSTVDKRRTCCQAEVDINRRTARSLYLGILPITRDQDSTLTLNGKGPAVDWVVEMVRFPQEAIFASLADEARLDRFAMEHLADGIARFHAKAEVISGTTGAGRLQWVVENNQACFAELPDGILDPAAVRRLYDAAMALLAQITPLLERRAGEAKIRHCHGDLHLRNIVAHEGEPVLFDAIEFDPAVADIDVLYDLAFLLMDLEFRGLGKQANIVLNRYLDSIGDAGGLAALPLFLSVRAGIRAHISAAAIANQTDPAEAAMQADAARRYLALAEAYLRLPSPRLIAVGGFSGSGKSRLARDLAPILSPPMGIRVVRTDATRKRLSGAGMLSRLGSGGYTEEMNQRTYEAVFDEAATVLAAGHSVIVDAVFLKPDERQRVQRVAEDAGVPFHAVWLETSSALLQERVTRRKMNVSDATAFVVQMQLASDLGEMPWPRLDTSGTKEETVEKALPILGIEHTESEEGGNA